MLSATTTPHRLNGRAWAKAAGRTVGSGASICPFEPLESAGFTRTGNGTPSRPTAAVSASGSAPAANGG